MNHNLTPTPIVDKNGKSTTVHRKSEPAAKSTSSIPGPNHGKITEERKLRAAIAYKLDKIELHVTRTQQEKDVVATLNSMDLDALKPLYETTRMVHALDRIDRFRYAAATLTAAIQINDQQTIDIIKEHGHKISGHLNMKVLVSVVDTLRYMNNSVITFTDNIDAHIEAAGKLFALGGTQIPANYAMNNKLIRFINKHPDKVDEVLAYRDQYSLEIYDDDNFQEWLNAGVLRDGVL